MIPLMDLSAQYKAIQPEIDEAIRRTLETGRFILGPEVEAFEREVAEYLGSRHAVGLASGTDALTLSLRALGIGKGDEVLVPAYSFFATVESVLHVGAVPVFVDIDPATYCLDARQAVAKRTERTKAIIAVHLYGHPADMAALMEFSQACGLKLIEDNAQAFGAEYDGRKTGGLGHVGCHSFFPSKNLGAFGDGGMATTDDEEVAEKIRMLRTHGWRKKYYPEVTGYNSRLDALQAAVLRVKLRYIDQWNQRRRELAQVYRERLAHLGLALPREADFALHAYHLFVIRVGGRAVFQRQLKERGISSAVYYPQPLHLVDPCRRYANHAGAYPESEKASRETLAIPMYPEMTEPQTDQVIQAVEAATRVEIGRPHR